MFRNCVSVARVIVANHIIAAFFCVSDEFSEFFFAAEFWFNGENLGISAVVAHSVPTNKAEFCGFDVLFHKLVNKFACSFEVDSNVHIGFGFECLVFLHTGRGFPTLAHTHCNTFSRTSKTGVFFCSFADFFATIAFQLIATIDSCHFRIVAVFEFKIFDHDVFFWSKTFEQETWISVVNAVFNATYNAVIFF